MKKLLLLSALSCFLIMVKAQSLDFQPDKNIANVKGKVQAMASGENFVIVPADNPNGRYISAQLPEEYKKDGLEVKFSGVVGKIPPNARMLGTPLKITSICVTKASKKKFKLKKTKYIF